MLAPAGSGRPHCVAASRASLHHRDLTTGPSAGVFDGFAWSWVLRLSRLEQVKDVLRARCRPKSQEMVIRISEGPTATDGDKPRIPNLGEDHRSDTPPPCFRPTPQGARGQAAFSTVASFEDQGAPTMPCRLAGTHRVRPAIRSHQRAPTGGY